MSVSIKRIVAVSVMILTVLSLRAQVVVNLSQFNDVINTDVTFTIRKAGTEEPVQYASAYIIPQKDTIVTGFAISDKDGYVEMKDVVSGKYELNVEMLGFKPFRKEYSIRGWEQYLGVIYLEEDSEFLDAAKVSANVDPVTFANDTIIYNAAAFRVGETAVLEDLIRLMPGMAVDENGNVTVNGEKVDKITVGGKTFFFDDPSMTLKNLPAKFVDKIKVMDKTSDEAAGSGIVSKSDKEKVMDVQLKEEYKQGTFGNLKALGGASAADKNKDALRDDPGLLFNASTMFAAYNEKDQLTLLANGKNTDIPGEGAFAVMYDSALEDEVDIMAGKNGLLTTAQAGANYNTSRIKGIDSNVSASYTYSSNDAAEHTARTSFLEGADNMETVSDFNGVATDNRLVVSGSLSTSDDDSKLYFAVRPSFTYTDSERSTNLVSNSGNAAGSINDSRSGQMLNSKKIETGAHYSFYGEDLGRKGRSFNVYGSLFGSSGNGNSSEISETAFASGEKDIRNLLYDRNSHSLNGYIRGAYTEPLTEKFFAEVGVSGNFDSFSSDKDAFNGADGSANKYYSSYSRRNSGRLSERIRAQYKFNDDNSIIFGVKAFQTQNVTDSESFGVQNKIGEGEWLLNWAPSVELQLTKNKWEGIVSYEGSSSVPSGSSLTPAIDISNPLQIGAGNIYLRPSFGHTALIIASFMDPKKGVSLNLSGNVRMVSDETVSASWFDGNGVRYAIPVNAGKPSGSMMTYLYFNSPLGKSRMFNFSGNFSYRYVTGTSYQAESVRDGFNKDDFNYSEMMADFWGDKDGNRFYSGESGFRESSTNVSYLSSNLGLSFRKGAFSARADAYMMNRNSRYSLDPNANTNTWDFSVDGRVDYMTDNGFVFSADCDYSMYRGYSEGMNKNLTRLNASISKTFKSVTFSVKAVDLFDQNRSYSRNVNAEYAEDIIRNTLGRFFLAGVSFNFGKMNAKNNSNAQRAMLNMIR